MIGSQEVPVFVNVKISLYAQINSSYSYNNVPYLPNNIDPELFRYENDETIFSTDIRKYNIQRIASASYAKSSHPQFEFKYISKPLVKVNHIGGVDYI